MATTTLVFALMGLPVGHGLGTEILVNVFHTDPSLAAIRSVDEAVVIGAALSLSSSAFVLQLMNESGELATRFGSATLGVLLLQDIAVVPFLVLLPVVVHTDLAAESTAGLLASLGPTAAKTVLGLGALLLGGRFVLRRIFELVAEARSDETFVALCLLTVTGASLCTQRLGFSDTLGAFAAGVLLAETNYRTQVCRVVWRVGGGSVASTTVPSPVPHVRSYTDSPHHAPPRSLPRPSPQPPRPPPAHPPRSRPTFGHSAASCWACSL